MNPRDVPDDVYAALASAAEANRQSLSAFVVERLTEVAQVARLDDYVAPSQPPKLRATVCPPRMPNGTKAP